MYRASLKIFLCLCCLTLGSAAKAQNHSFDFYTGTFTFSLDSSAIISAPKTASSMAVSEFYRQVTSENYTPLLSALKDYKNRYNLNDWIYYQLIRKTAEQLSPKAENYFRYTLYKWFLLSKCGYDARLAVGDEQVIFYVRNEEEIRDIPFFTINGHQYTCLNYHDYEKSFKLLGVYKPVNIEVPEATHAFSYTISRMPDFKPDHYTEKDLAFDYKHRSYHFKLKVNPDVSALFANYPGVDFQAYFNIPLSCETYGSLLPILKENLKNLNQKKGVDYLMRFTRYAFLYENDEEQFGKEKRLSPEQTLMNTYSDCDDRAALFFYLVKEIYNLPMVAVLYPTHLTMAVQFDQPIAGDYLIYQGKRYAFCEPTPQKQDLKIGHLAQVLKSTEYKIVYAYHPLR